MFGPDSHQLEQLVDKGCHDYAWDDLIAGLGKLEPQHLLICQSGALVEALKRGVLALRDEPAAHYRVIHCTDGYRGFLRLCGSVIGLVVQDCCRLSRL